MPIPGSGTEVGTSVTMVIEIGYQQRKWWVYDGLQRRRHNDVLLFFWCFVLDHGAPQPWQYDTTIRYE